MEDEPSEKLVAHVRACKLCTAANKRVNDFCAEGRILFAEYAKTHKPASAGWVRITKEQYERLEQEHARAQRSGERN